MNRICALLIIILSIPSGAVASRTTVAGVWLAHVGDTTYAMRLKSVSIDELKTIEQVRGNLTVRTMNAGRVTDRTVPVTGQFLIAKESVILSFGESGRQREHAVGIVWNSHIEAVMFSVRPGRPLDFHAATSFEAVPSEVEFVSE